MTQILTAACPNFVVQVSDRLVTTKRGAKTDEHDPTANKTVVYRAADALVTLGYSGLAYIGETPTDSWIAETLFQGDLAPKDGHLGTRFRAAAKPMRIGLALKRLADAIRALPAGDIDRYSLNIAIAGWQGERGGPRPIFVEILRVGGKTNIESQPRRWSKDRNFRIGSIGQELSVEALKKQMAPHRKEHPGGPPLRPEVVEQVFLNLIRETSDSSDLVGSNLLSVVLMRPGLGMAGCQFLPFTPHLAEITSPKLSQTVEVAHTPWVLSANIAYPPSMEIGDSELHLDGIDFHIFGAKPRDNLISMSSSLRRPPPPRR